MAGAAATSMTSSLITWSSCIRQGYNKAQCRAPALPNNHQLGLPTTLRFVGPRPLQLDGALEGRSLPSQLADQRIQLLPLSGIDLQPERRPEAAQRILLVLQLVEIEGARRLPGVETVRLDLQQPLVELDRLAVLAETVGGVRGVLQGDRIERVAPRRLAEVAQGVRQPVELRLDQSPLQKDFGGIAAGRDGAVEDAQRLATLAAVAQELRQ